MEKVAILMSSFMGEKFIKKQLISIINQTHKNWSLWISDDGSTDNTLTIIKAIKCDKIKILKGPNLGSYALNFLSLIKNKNIKADYFAFSDQDDIWKSNKLANAILNIKKIDRKIPAAYCSRSILINSEDQKIGLSKTINIKPNFKNALIQNIMSGNTIVFNYKCKKLIEKSNITNLSSHDWLIYQIITGSGGFVYYDQNPSIYYRQHDNNLIGAQNSFFSFLKRIIYHFDGTYKNTLNTQLRVLLENKFLLSKTNQNILNCFLKNKSSCNLFKRLQVLKLGVFRFSKRGNLAFLVSIILNKI